MRTVATERTEEHILAQLRDGDEEAASITPASRQRLVRICAWAGHPAERLLDHPAGPAIP